MESAVVVPWWLKTAGWLVALVILFYLWAKRKHTYWKRMGVNYEEPHWFFGNVKEALMLRMQLGFLLGKIHKRAAEKDDIFGFYILQRPYLMIRNPQLIKQIFVKDFHVFPNRYFSPKNNKDMVGSTNLFALDNPEWKYLRMRMSPAFSSGKIKKLFNLMVESANMTKEYLDEQFADGAKVKRIRTKDTFVKYATDIISSVAFGIRTNSFEKPTPEFYHNSIEAFKVTLVKSLRFFTIFFFPEASSLFTDDMLGEYTGYFRKVFWDSMDSRESSKAKRGDLIDSLLELKKEKQENAFKFEGDVLLAQSSIFFVAGRETTVTTICYTLWELARHPEIQTRVREEILEMLKVRGMTYESVQDMKYLYQVISETLRLYPPAPLIDRVAVEDYQVPGTKVVLKKGTPVYVILPGLHTDPRYYPDPMRFDPDRFSEERKGEIQPYTYMPFGEGPHICIGMRLGLLQVAVGLVTVLAHYEVSCDPSEKVKSDPRSIFVVPMKDCSLDFKKISQ